MSIQKSTQSIVPQPDQNSESWQRARPYEATIKQLGRYGFFVTLPGGERHQLALANEDDEHTGRCDCKGWRYRHTHGNEHCAHIAAIIKADYIGDVEDVDGEIVRLEETQVMDVYPEGQR